MRRGEWWPEAELLKAEGLTDSEIARRVGVTPGAVRKALNPEARAAYNARTLATRDRERHREVDRAWRQTENARGRCQRCGDLMGMGYKVNCTPGQKEWTCRKCRMAVRHERSLMIVEWWAAGESLRQIRDRLGWSRGMVAVEFHRMREQGYDLPYRYAVGSDGRRQAA